MINYLLKVVFFTFLLPVIFAQSLLAQVRFTATISPGSIGKNETAELRLIIENARQVDNFIPPSLTDFNILSGPNQESGMESSNGVTKQYIGITYTLQPKAKGKFTIGAATAKADGKILKTIAVTLKVGNATAAGSSQNNNNSPFGNLSSFFDEPTVQQTANRDFILKKGENIQAKIDKNIFIKLTMDKSSCYIGEPLVVTYKLYTRLKSESSITKNPYFNGFSVIDLVQPGNSNYSIEKLNGREYNVYILRKAQLYPLQAGAMEVEAAEVENNIHFIKEDYLKTHPSDMNDVMNGLPQEAMQDEKVTIESKPVMIDVKALPDTNKPASFKGAVGKFSISAAVEKANFTTDDAGKLQVVVSGEGNMELINAPDVIWPDSIESFDPKIIESLNKQAVPVSGSKIFEYPFTITKPGTYTLPAITYSFFDVASKSYKSVATLPILITVSKGAERHVVTNNNNAQNDSNKTFFEDILSHRFLIIIPIVLIILVGLFFWIKKENKKEAAQIIKVEKKISTVPFLEKVQPIINPLEATEASLLKQNSKGFYQSLNKDMHNFLAAQLQVPTSLINKKNIGEELDKNNIPFTTSLQIQQLLNEIELQLYTPFAEENKMEEMYALAKNIVRDFVVG